MRPDEVRDLTRTMAGSLPGAFLIFAGFGLMPAIIYLVGIFTGFASGRMAPRWLHALKCAQVPRIRLEWA